MQMSLLLHIDLMAVKIPLKFQTFLKILQNYRFREHVRHMLNPIAMLEDFKMLYSMQGISILYVSFAYDSSILQLLMTSNTTSVVCVYNVWDFDLKLARRRKLSCM